MTRYENRDAWRAEEEAWGDVVRWLKRTGAVTDVDCALPRDREPMTPGQALFAALRRWEKAAIDLALVEQHA